MLVGTLRRTFVVHEFETGFEAADLYFGEPDLFAFFVDVNDWVNVGDQKFAPGFLVSNSEVGKRSLGFQILVSGRPRESYCLGRNQTGKVANPGTLQNSLSRDSIASIS